MSGKLIIGTLVHYTTKIGEGKPPSDLAQHVTPTPRHPLDKEPAEYQTHSKPTVFPAIIIAVNDHEKGDVQLKVEYPTSSVHMKSCLPSDKAGGTHEARGCWTPLDRPNWEEPRQL